MIRYLFGLLTVNPRTLKVLEFDKILDRVSAYCSFSGGAELARALLPSDDLDTVRESLLQTTEAYKLLEQKMDIHFGGVSDVRPALEKAERSAMLMTQDLLDVKNTLMRARNLQRIITRLENVFPKLAEIAYAIESCDHVVTEIGRCISDRAEVVDGASTELSRIRSQLRVAQDRLLGTLDKLVHHADVKPYLQDALVTQRQGRYVIPVRAESKGHINGIVHDQSASGATLFIEPLKVVEQNNAVRELELQENQEVRRVLIELTELVADEAHYIRENVRALAMLDFTFAKARYAYEIDASTPEIVEFRRAKVIPPPKGEKQAADNEIQSIHPGSVMNLRRARHPLLEAESVVPIDIYLDESYYLIVVTGPNTGGKTVTLKTAGLLALMAQAGMMIPVEPGSALSVFEGVYADIGDEQSIEQNLSTFSSHMTNIIAILEEADPRSLVLLDELGAGTDPDEGSALAMALLDNLRDRGITTLSTTHYSDLKLYAHNTPGVRNASVEFDIQSLRPTYELSIGLPGRSNALIIARRLGLNPTIVDKAENIVRPDTLQADSLLEDIKAAKQEAQRREASAKERERHAQVIEADLRHQLASIEEARRVVIADVRETMASELDEARKEIEQIRRQLTRTGTFSAGNTHEEFLARAERELAKRQVDRAIDPNVIMPSSGEETLVGPIEVGDRVWVPSLQASGQLLSLNTRTQEGDVQLGNFRLKLPLKRMELRQKAVKESEAAPIRAAVGAQSTFRSSAAAPKMELDLRGTRVEEGVDQVDTYIDRAYNDQLPWVRIIHGKGTGALRNAVRDLLKGHPLVKEFRAGKQGEGDDGVTVAYLVQVD